MQEFNLIIAFFFVTTIMAGIISFIAYRQKKVKQILKNTALALKLEVDHTLLEKKLTISGKKNGNVIRVEAYNENEGYVFKMTWQHNLVHNAGFKLIPKSWSENLFDIGFDPSHTLDHQFDKSMICSSKDPVILTALLNKSVREKILKLNKSVHELSISNDEIKAKQSLLNISNYKGIIWILDDMMAISKDFSQPDSLKNRLIDNFRTEKNNSIRLKNLKLLNRHFPKDNQIVSALRSALKDNHFEIMIEAAKNIGIEGMQHLTGLLKDNSRFTPDQLIEIVKLLEKQKFTESIHALADLCRSNADIELRIEILKTFKAFGAPKLSKFLTTLLENDDSRIQTAVIEALGTCGTIESIEKLYLFSKHSISPFTRHTVQKSIDRIQSRSGKAEKGWLSVSELSELDGALSHDLSPNDAED